MHGPHVASGGRYPVLRSLALIYLLLGVVLLIAGVIAAGWELFRAPEPDTATRVRFAITGIAIFFLASMFMFGFAELIKLFIDIEHNTRMASAATPVGALGSVTAPGGRTWLAGEETAEGALVRGH